MQEALVENIGEAGDEGNEGKEGGVAGLDAQWGEQRIECRHGFLILPVFLYDGRRAR